MMCETTQRLLALLRIVERGPAGFGALGDDAVLDAWFGVRSRLGGCAPAADPLEETPQAAAAARPRPSPIPPAAITGTGPTASTTAWTSAIVVASPRT